MQRSFAVALAVSILAAGVVLVGACGTPRQQADQAADAGATDAGAVAAGPVTGLRQAQLVAEPVARAEIARVQEERRRRDPAVLLRFEDYRVTVADQPENYAVRYEYANMNPPFLRWSGHGMRFSILVNKTTGVARVVRVQ